MSLFKLKTIKNKVSVFFVFVIIFLFICSFLVMNTFSKSLHNDFKALSEKYYYETNTLALSKLEQSELMIVSNLMDEKSYRVNSILKDLERVIELISFSLSSLSLNHPMEKTSTKKMITPDDFENSSIYKKTLVKDPNFSVPVSFDYPDMLLKSIENTEKYNFLFWEVAPIFQKFHKIYSHSLWTYLGFSSDGSFINYPGTYSEPGEYDPRLRPWYLAAVKAKGKPVWVKPYFDSGQGSLVTTISKVIYYEKTTVPFAVVGTDVLLNLFLMDITKIDNDFRNIAFLVVDQDNQIIFKNGDQSVFGDWKYIPQKSFLEEILGEDVSKRFKYIPYAHYKKELVNNENLYIYKRKLQLANWTLVGILKESDLGAVLDNTREKLSVITQSSANNFAIKISEQKQFYILIFFIILIGSVFFLFIILNNNLVKPIHRIVELIKNFSEQEKESLFINNSINSDDEVGEVINEIFKLKKSIKTYQLQLLEQNEIRIIAQTTSQVAHDIRSPLSALNMAMYSLQQVPEEKRVLIRNAVGRINDIANQLLEKGKSASKNKDQSKDLATESLPKEILMVSSLVDGLVSEKRIIIRENPKILLEANLQKSYGLFILANGSELKRVISNLINNSIEALGEYKGSIEVVIESSANEVIISIQDNGKGIPPHVLQKLGEKGVTHGKDSSNSGNGLGVYHAKATIESFGGRFKVESTEGKGTNVQLIFPKAETPDWFVSEITLSENQTVVVCDDDSSIHGLWSGRLKSVLSSNSTIQEIHFSSREAIIAWHQQNPQPESCLYLMDYELFNSEKNGLDLIEELHITSNSILVSSRFEEVEIKARCKKLGVRLIPKGLSSLIPIKIKKTKVKYDAILIDDDSLVHMTWNMMAKEKSKSILCFESESLFQKVMSEIDQNTPIFIDMNLSQGVSGLDVAKRAHDSGFINIHLATGYDADSIQRPEFIKSIVGKDFPWS